LPWDASPEDFGPYAQVVPEEHVAANTGKGTTGQRLGLTVAAARVSSRANVVLTPNAMSIFWACAKFENAATGAGKRQENSDT
jgi:hypothetical protein